MQTAALLRVPLLNLSFEPSFEAFLNTNGGLSRFEPFLNLQLNLSLIQIVVLLRVPLLNLSFEPSFETFLNTNGGFA